MTSSENKKEFISYHSSTEYLFLRHSVKSTIFPEFLCEAGRELAMRKSRDVCSGFDADTNIRVYTSDILRARETGEIIRSYAQIKDKVTELSLLSEYPYTDETITQSGLGGGMWLMLRDGLIRDGITLPPVSALAGKIASFIKNTVDNPRTDNHTQSIIAISHIPPMLAFMGLVVADSRGSDFIDDSLRQELIQGNMISPMEGFRLYIRRSNTGDNINVIFRGYDFSVSGNFLDRLHLSALQYPDVL